MLLAAMGAAALSPEELFGNEEKNGRLQLPVNGSPIEFPARKEITGIADIRTHIKDAARKVLCIIPEISSHDHLLFTSEGPIQRCQLEIRNALIALMSHELTKMKTVFLGGFSGRIPKEYYSGISPEEMLVKWHILQEIGATRTLQTARDLHVVGGENRLALEQWRPILVADTKKMESEIYDSMVLEFIRSMAEADGDIVYAVHSAAHDWIGITKEWNRRHPEFPLSCLLLIPNELKEFELNPYEPKIAALRRLLLSHLGTPLTA